MNMKYPRDQKKSLRLIYKVTCLATGEMHYCKAKNYPEAKRWVQAHLDTSKQWRIEVLTN